MTPAFARARPTPSARRRSAVPGLARGRVGGAGHDDPLDLLIALEVVGIRAQFQAVAGQID
jgi:hypothetical protein